MAYEKFVKIKECTDFVRNRKREKSSVIGNKSEIPLLM